MISEPTDSTAIFDYALRRPPWHKRRGVRRWLLGASLAALVASAYWWAAPIRDRVVVLYRQHQCLTYFAPPSQIVYDERAASEKQPIWDGKCLTHGTLSDHKYDGDTALAWRQFPLATNRADAMLFLHERTSPSGNSRLVVLELRFLTHAATGSWSDYTLYRTPVAMVIRLGSMTTQPVLSYNNAVQSVEFTYEQANEGCVFTLASLIQPTHRTSRCDTKCTGRRGPSTDGSWTTTR
jgi:hypothetical protein